MKKIKPLLRTLLSCAMALLCMLGLAPATVTAAGTYTLHVVDDLQNSYALYRDYVKENHLTIGYITNLTSPMWNVTSKDFKLATHDSKTYLYTPCSMKHYLQQARYGNNQRAHRWMSGQRKYGIDK